MRGAEDRGAEAVRDLSGGAGIVRVCSWSDAFLTQKWTVDLGRTGLRDLAITPRDQPASQSALNREGTSSGGMEARKRTSSSGSFCLCFITLSYSVFQKRTVDVEAAEALDEALKYMNSTLFCFWPARRLCREWGLFQIVSRYFFYFLLDYF
jgi:hypothetical protein